MNEIVDWACAYLVRVDAGFANLNHHQQRTENLFTSGRLDSMGLMELLLEAEMQFGFAFTPEAFQDRRIQTIEGLAAVINELRST